jgi:hypothetical protein
MRLPRRFRDLVQFGCPGRAFPHKIAGADVADQPDTV